MSSSTAPPSGCCSGKAARSPARKTPKSFSTATCPTRLRNCAPRSSRWRAAFAQHGMCGHAPRDPDFDRACFSMAGTSFEADLAKAADDPMTCGRPASDYRPYASRARWIRTANDSYFTAMTYPEGMPAMLKPSDIHDAIWGVLSAVYGGAVHPTAEGYAAMADAALPAARGVPGWAAPPVIRAEPLPPPPTGPAPAAAATPAPVR